MNSLIVYIADTKKVPVPGLCGCLFVYMGTGKLIAVPPLYRGGIDLSYALHTLFLIFDDRYFRERSRNRGITGQGFDLLVNRVENP